MEERIGVIYYSRTGNGEFVATEFHKRLNSDLIRIETQQDLKGKKILQIVVGGFQVITKKTPPLKEYKFDVDNYDILVIETPVWVDTFAPAIRTFLKDQNINNKKIFLICCYDGGIEDTFQNLKEELRGNKFIGEVAFKQALDNKDETVKTIEYLVKKINES